MSNMLSPYPKLAERIYITNSYQEFDNITKYHLLEKESLSNQIESALKIV